MRDPELPRNAGVLPSEASPPAPLHCVERGGARSKGGEIRKVFFPLSTQWRGGQGGGPGGEDSKGRTLRGHGPVLRLPPPPQLDRWPHRLSFARGTGRPHRKPLVADVLGLLGGVRGGDGGPRRRDHPASARERTAGCHSARAAREDEPGGGGSGG